MTEDDEIQKILEMLAPYHEDAFPIYNEMMELVDGENSHAALVALSMTTATVLSMTAPSKKSADLAAYAIAKSVVGSMDQMEKDHLCLWQETVQ